MRIYFYILYFLSLTCFGYMIHFCIKTIYGYIKADQLKYKKLKEKFEKNKLLRIHLEKENILLAQNIDEYIIGEIVLDKTFKNRECKITNKTENALEVYITAKDKHKKYEERKGIDHKQWFYIGDFNKRFKKI